MSLFAFISNRRARGWLAALLLLAGAGYLLRPWPNSVARWRVNSILAASTTPAETARELAPYVALGDHYGDVHRRLAPVPDAIGGISMPTEWSLQLGKGPHLVLAIAQDEQIVGIGRRFSGETEWLVGPKW